MGLRGKGVSANSCKKVGYVNILIFFGFLPVVFCQDMTIDPFAMLISH